MVVVLIYRNTMIHEVLRYVYFRQGRPGSRLLSDVIPTNIMDPLNMASLVPNVSKTCGEKSTYLSICESQTSNSNHSRIEWPEMDLRPRSRPANRSLCGVQCGVLGFSINMCTPLEKKSKMIVTGECTCAWDI